MKDFIVYVVLALFISQAPALAKKVHYQNGDFYSGGWDRKQSCPKGKGTMQYANGDCYIGLWVNGKQQGLGKMSYADGSVFDGEWWGGEKEGQGVMYYSDGSLYQGQWKGGMWHGTGHLEKNGSIYDGEWARGKKEGQGAMYYSDGSSYQGQWKKDIWNGNGRLDKNGNIYDGEWVEGIMEGQGSMTYADGRSYQGQWKNGVWDGYGRLVQDGCIFSGIWKDGSINGKGSITYADGSSYSGNLKNGEKEGYGSMKYSDGSSYYGEWLNNRCFGEGIRINANQESIQSSHWDGEDFGLPATITNQDGGKRRIYTDGTILREYRKENNKYSFVNLKFPELGSFKCFIFQHKDLSLEEELFQANRFPIKYLAEGFFSFDSGEIEFCFNRPILAWGETAKPELLKGEWTETDVYAKPLGGRDNDEIDSTPNYTQSATVKTYLTDRRFTFNANGTGVFVASTITFGYVSAMTGTANSGGFYYSYTTSGGFGFTTTGTVKITFSWKLDEDGLLKLKPQTVSPSVKSEPDIEKYRSQCDPTYFRQWSSSIKNSFKSYPDVKHTEKRVRELLGLFKEIVFGDFAVLFPGTEKMYLYDLNSDSKHKSLNHPYKIMDSIMGFERPHN